MSELKRMKTQELGIELMKSRDPYVREMVIRYERLVKVVSTAQVRRAAKRKAKVVLPELRDAFGSLAPVKEGDVEAWDRASAIGVITEMGYSWRLHARVALTVKGEETTDENMDRMELVGRAHERAKLARTTAAAVGL